MSAALILVFFLFLAMWEQIVDFPIGPLVPYVIRQCINSDP